MQLGKLPACYQLRNRAIFCELNGGHFHMVEGGWVLDQNLELMGSGLIGPIECKTKLVQNIM